MVPQDAVKQLEGAERMAVATVTTFQVRPGRNVEFMAQVAEGKKNHERLGGRVRVWMSTFAGPNAGQAIYVIEHKDLAAYASFSQKMEADPAWQAFVAKVFTGDPTGTLVGQSLVTEVTP